ncbi:MAG: DNA polymerase III subunit psi [Colwellia sp.]|nr:DNA polymerase III subunit psi [Colwellia sp.]
MTITKRQFSQLQAMGIDLWQLKKTGNDVITDKANHLDIELVSLLKTPLFLDVITSLELSVGEITCHDNKLSLGLLTWYFSANEEIAIDQHNHLVTPSLSTLKNSPQLKRTLWQKLQELSPS